VWGWWPVAGGIGGVLLADFLKWLIVHVGDRDLRPTHRPPF
jgi:hypothetical protein